MSAEKTPAIHVHDVADEASEDVLATFFQAREQATPEKVAPTSKAQAATPDTDELVDETTPPEKSEAVAGEEPLVEGEEESSEAPALPEGMVAVPVVPDKLVTEFVLRDETGELEVPALTVEYKANGKMRRDRLDQVVKMAQQGVYNHEREVQLRQREEQVGKGAEEAKSTLKLREEQLEALLMDPDRYEAARERYMAANAPDQQVARLQAQLRERDNEATQARSAMAAKTFLDSEVVPALSTISQNLPEVSEEELSQQLAVGMYPFMVNGVVPVERYGDIRRYIVEHLTQWARETHETRLRRFSSATQKADSEVKKAQVVAQRLKSTVGRVTKPIGRASAAPVSKAQPKVNPSVDEAVDDAMSEAMRGAGLMG